MSHAVAPNDQGDVGAAQDLQTQAAS